MWDKPGTVANRILMAACLLIASLWVAWAGPSKTVRDWTVYCSDTLVCSLSALFRSDALYSIEFRRPPDAHAPIMLRIAFADRAATESNIVLSVPGVMERFVLQQPVSVTTDGLAEFADERILATVMPALKDGHQLVLSFDSANGRQEANISLSGSSAAMLFMDEVQNRVGKTDALVATGPLTPTGRKTRAIDLTSLNDVPAPVRRLWEGDPEMCSGQPDEDLIKQFGGTAITFSGETDAQLFILPCGWPGAYNINHHGYLYDAAAGSARVLAFPTMAEEGPTVTGSITNGSWDELAGQLTSYYKGRGLGDCGVFSKWEWRGDGVYGNFVLVEERAKADCDGKNDEWPLAWPQRQGPDHRH